MQSLAQVWMRAGSLCSAHYARKHCPIMVISSNRTPEFRRRYPRKLTTSTSNYSVWLQVLRKDPEPVLAVDH